MKIEYIPLNKIIAGNNDRKDFRNVMSLAASIKESGLLQPIKVHKLITPIPKHVTILPNTPNECKIKTSGEYEIIMGESRYQAHTILKLPTIACIVTNQLDNELIERQMLIENVTRDGLNPIELAEAFQKAINRGETIEDIKGYTGLKESFISGRLTLLDLKPEYQDMVKVGQLKISYALAMYDLTTTYQKPAIDWLIAQEGQASLTGFKDKCQDLRDKQTQASQLGLFTLGEIETIKPKKVTRPIDPTTYKPVFSLGGDMVCKIGSEIEKWENAKEQWKNSPLKGAKVKAQQCQILLNQLYPILNALQFAPTTNKLSIADKVINYLSEVGQATKSRLQQYTNTTSNRLTKTLEHMVENGQVVKVKSGRGFRYSLN